MAKPKLRKKARELRKQGWQLIDVATELEVSYTVVREWCRDIELTDEQIEDLYKNNPSLYGQQMGAQANKEMALQRRLAFQDVGREQARDGSLLHLMGCMLYWGEGGKHRQKVKLTNTDPNMLVLFRRFLREELTIPDEKIVLQILSHSNDEAEHEQIKQYWLETLDLPTETTVTVTIKKGTKSRKARYDNGICSINVYSTEVVQQVFGAIQEYIGFENPKWVK